MDENPSNDKHEEPPAAALIDIGAEVELFVNQVDALADTLPLANLAIQQARTKSSLELVKFLRDECTISKAEGKSLSYNIALGQMPRLSRFRRRVHRAELAQSLVPRGLLVALVSQFDAFIGRLIRQLLMLKLEIVDSSGRNFTFAELVKFDSIDAIRDYVIEKEIESVLRGSHTEQFIWLETKFNLPLRQDLPVWPIFIELTERRNLFVHTNGQVSRQYLEVCRRNACNVSEVAVGSHLTLTREYFTSASECLLELGIKLAQVLWRKISPNDLQKADSNLIGVTYEFVSEGRYRLARVLLDFATESLHKHSSEECRMNLIVNRAQAYKWSGDEAKCKEILSNEDWTAVALKFALAHAVLLSDFDTAIALVKQLGNDDKHIEKHAYREWPLFRDLRKNPAFIDTFEELFNEPLNKFTLHDERGTPPPIVN